MVANISSITKCECQVYKCISQYFTYKRLRNILSGHRREIDYREMDFSISTLSDEGKEFFFMSCNVVKH